MMHLIQRLPLAVVMMISTIQARAEVASSIDAPVQVSRSNKVDLPHCVDTELEVAGVKDSVNANRKNEFKYDKYRQITAGDSELQLLTRLAYAETMAANCPEKRDKIYPGIVAVIVHRLQNNSCGKKSSQIKCTVRDVVFQLNQFASSLNIYDESQYKEFLCPRDSRLWTQIYAESQAMLNGSQSASGLSQKATMYFLYKHSPKYEKEPWVAKEEMTSATQPSQSCIRFFQGNK